MAGVARSTGLPQAAAGVGRQGLVGGEWVGFEPKTCWSEILVDREPNVDQPPGLSGQPGRFRNVGRGIADGLIV
jgi:hypothetical protein